MRVVPGQNVVPKTSVGEFETRGGDRSMTKSRRKTVLVAGGAGFLGSHLCDALLGDGFHVIALDNLLTGRRSNSRHLEREPHFHLIESDIISPLPAELKSSQARIDRIFNLASAASPPHYQADPEHTLLTNVIRYSPSAHPRRGERSAIFSAPPPARFTAIRRFIRRRKTTGANANPNTGPPCLLR